MFAVAFNLFVMCDGPFGTSGVLVIGNGEIGFVVFQPIGNGALFVWKLSGNQSYVSSVGDDVTPIVFQNLFRLYGFSVNKKSRSVSVQSVYHMGSAFLFATSEVFIQDRFYAESVVVGSHGEDANILFYHNQEGVFLDNFDEFVVKLLCGFVAADFNSGVGEERSVVPCGDLSIDFNSATFQYGFCLVSADAIVFVGQEG